MATFVVCTRCGRVQEIAGIDQLPDHWRRSPDELLCPRCCLGTPDGVMDEILEEEVIYPSHHNDTIDETFNEEDLCDVCRGPCQGH